MRPKDIAERLGSVRNVYRDLRALEAGEAPSFGRGRWGLSPRVPAAMAHARRGDGRLLGARLMVRYADKYDPDLASAFEARRRPSEGDQEHVARSLDVLGHRRTQASTTTCAS
jgi:hypothetical protein